MFSSGEQNYADPDMSVAGLDPKNVTTIEQARPLPVLWGTQRMGVTFVSDAINRISEPRMQSVGKGEDIITGYHYYLQFAALVCHGPVSAIHAIYFDSKKVWPLENDSGPLVASGNKTALLFNNNSTLWDIYWGTENQVIDTRPVSIPAETPHTVYLDELADPLITKDPDNQEFHPAYKGQCYIVARLHYMGYNRTSVQNIELVVTRCPTYTGITTAKIGTAGMEDSNIPVIIADALTNKRYGLGLPTSYIDTASFAATATTLAAEGVGISPVLTSCQPIEQFIVDVLNYVDGFIYTTPEGKIGIGLNRGVPCQNDEESENLKVLRIDETCLIERPRLKTPSIAQSRNMVYVSFTNMDADYQKDSAPGHSTGTLAMQGDQNSPQILDRPWVTNVHTAAIMASIAAKVLSLPADELTCKIRRSTFVRPDGLPIMPGNGVYFSYSLYRLCHAHYVIQEIRQGDPHEPFLELTLKRDRGYVNVEENDPADNYEAPGSPVGPTPGQILNWTVMEVPSGMSKSVGYDFPSDGRPKVIVCASRPETIISNALLSYLAVASPADWTPFYVRGSGFNFSPYGHLLNDLGQDDVTASFVVESQYDELITLSSGEFNGSNFDYVLIPFVQTDWGISYITNEIIGVFVSAYNSGSMTYTLDLVRGAWDTCPDGYRLPITSNHRWFFCKVSRLNWATFSKAYAENALMTFMIQSLAGSTPSDAAVSAQVDNQRSVHFHNRHTRPITPKTVICSDTWNESANLTVSWTDPVTLDPDVNTWRYLDVRAESDADLVLNPAPSASSASPLRLYYAIPADNTSIIIPMSDLVGFAGSTIKIGMWTKVGGVISSYFSDKFVTYA